MFGELFRTVPKAKAVGSIDLSFFARLNQFLNLLKGFIISFLLEM